MAVAEQLMAPVDGSVAAPTPPEIAVLSVDPALAEKEQ